MQVIDLIRAEKPSLSFEVFPPKTSASFDSVRTATEEIAALKPDFMSVTYGAGGTTAGFTAEIAENIQQRFGVPVLAHLTCVNATAEKLETVLNDLQARGIENVLALRGDLPEGYSADGAVCRYAGELAAYIRARSSFCIGGACYPESHPESPDSFTDIRRLKEKVESGCSFLTTQMFFDNNIFYNFVYRLREAGVTVPVVAGIMPVTNAKQIRRIMSISQSALPQRFLRIVDRFGDKPEAMLQAGVAYATEQIIDLVANGVQAVHVYTMNKPEVATRIRTNLSGIL